MEKNITPLSQEPVEDKTRKYNIEISEQKLILDIELLSNSLIINIIDSSEMIPIIYQNELTFDNFKEKDSNLSGLGNISKTFDYLKSLIEQKKYSAQKENEETYIFSFIYQLFNEEKKIDINIPKQKFDEKEHNKQISLAINNLDKNLNLLENKVEKLEKNYQKDLIIQNEKLGLDNINNIKSSFCMKNEKNNINIELRIINDLLEISFVENKNILEEKYSIKLALKDFCLKDEYFTIMKNINQLHDFIKAIFENNKYKINKLEKEEAYLLEIYFISGINEKKIEFQIVKNPFSIVESIKQYTHSINYINEQIEKNKKYSEEKISNLDSDFNRHKTENDNNFKNLNDNINANKNLIYTNTQNLTNNISNYNKSNEQKISDIKNSLDNDFNKFKQEFNQRLNEMNDILRNKIKKEILDMSHPIGSYYWSQNNTNPSTIFGGKWQQIRGRFLFAEDQNHAAGSSGGEELHTLSIDEMPGHNHTFPNRTCVFGNIPDIQIQGGGGSKKLYENAGNIANTNNIGGGKPHNNMPPYIAAFCWRRDG